MRQHDQIEAVCLERQRGKVRDQCRLGPCLPIIRMRFPEGEPLVGHAVGLQRVEFGQAQLQRVIAESVGDRVVEPVLFPAEQVAAGCLRIAHGEIDEESNPNGSLDNIAGICNAGRNVFGMMPHPERASDKELFNEDGRLLFESILSN
jgi:hypothetical protein